MSVSYKLDKPEFSGEGSELYGYVEGQKYRIEVDDDIQCMNLISEYDFDEDGLKDALIEIYLHVEEMDRLICISSFHIKGKVFLN